MPGGFKPVKQADAQTFFCIPGTEELSMGKHRAAWGNHR